MRVFSLVQRILIASLILLPISIGFSALLINRAYVTSLNKAELASLLAQTYALIESAEPSNEADLEYSKASHREPSSGPYFSSSSESFSEASGESSNPPAHSKGTLVLPPALANPLFETSGSGLYARVYHVNTGANTPNDKLPKQLETIVWQSNSSRSTLLQGVSLATHSPKPGTYALEELVVNNEPFQRLRFSTVWEIDSQDEIFVFELLSSLSKRNAEIKAYQKILWIWLAGMTALLILIQLIVMRWGLRPIKELAHEVRSIDAGEQQQILKSYPPELLPLSNNLNTLLATEEKQRTRYKNTLADLAHSLKTPLAVVRSHTSVLTTKPTEHSGDSGQDSRDTNNSHQEALKGINTQIDRMSDIVSHQLNRASAQSSIVSQSRCNLSQVVNRLGSALSKVYADKEIRFENLLPADTRYFAEENDMMELFGNILENAFKYGHGWVRIGIASENDESTTKKVPSNERLLILDIDDNGKGIEESVSRDILVRGARADTNQIGQGIGLSVATDILSSYGGGLEIMRSELGGARFRISLPLSKLHP